MINPLYCNSACLNLWLNLSDVAWRCRQRLIVYVTEKAETMLG